MLPSEFKGFVCEIAMDAEVALTAAHEAGRIAGSLAGHAAGYQEGHAAAMRYVLSLLEVHGEGGFEAVMAAVADEVIPDLDGSVVVPVPQ